MEIVIVPENYGILVSYTHVGSRYVRRPVARLIISVIVQLVVRFLLMPVIIRGNELVVEDESLQDRKGRVNGRIVKLYSGVKPDPILCFEEGFKADPVDCAVFYRCTKTSREKFTVYRFQCGPGTVYDPETEVCNHPINTKRSECGGLIPTAEQEEENEVEDQELPSPINTTSSSATSYPLTSTTQITEHFVDYKPVATVSYPTVATTGQEHVENSNNLLSYPGFDVINDTQNVAMTFTTMAPYPEKTSPCILDGFIGDSENCRKFYRCVSDSRGGFIRYEFFCSESTVWDDNIQSCNHAWAVRNRRCGRGDFSSNNNTYQPSSMLLQNNEIQSNNDAKLNEQHDYNIDRPKEEYMQYGNKINDEKHTKKPETIHTTTTSAYRETSVSSMRDQFYNKYEETDVKGANYDINEINHYHTTTSTYYIHNFQRNYTTSNTSIEKNVQCTESGFMADPVDCKKFYRCVDNGKGGFTRFDFSCSQDTVWDRKQEVCNHAWAVKECGGIISIEDLNKQVITNNPIKTSTTEKNNEEGFGNQIYQEPSNVQTTSSTSIIEQNKEEGYGNQINQETSNVQTTSSTVLTTISLLSTTESSKVTNAECTSDGFFGDVNDCQKFYRCINNEKGSFTRYNYVCGDGTLWDQSIQACNHAWAVNSCNQSTTINITPQTTNAHYSTVTTTVSYKETTINEDTNNGDDDSGYNSHENTAISKQPIVLETTTIKNLQIQQSNCQSSGFMGDANDCTKFYRCVDNGNGGYTRYEFSCGDSTVWDPEIEACNHAWAVKQCGGASSTQEEVTSHATKNDLGNGHTTPVYSSQSSPQMSTTLQTTTKTTQIITENNLCETNGFMGDKFDCKKFYRCVDNGDGKYIRYEFSCGDGTVWDSKLQACNHAWAVEECGNTLHTQTTQNNKEFVKPSTTPSSENENGYVTLRPTEKDISMSVTTSSSSMVTINVINSKQECQSIGFMGDQYNCKRFYRCVDNGNGGFTKFEFSCGEGTAWDSNIEACNHESAVQNCGSVHSQTQSEATTSSMQTPLTTTPSNNLLTETQQSQTQASYSSTTTLIDIEPQRPSPDNECMSDGFFGNINDCKKFYRCVNDGKGGYTKYEFSCGDGTVWVQEIQSCDHQSDDVNCSYSSSTVSTGKPEISSSSENTILNTTDHSESQTNENLDNNMPILQDEQGSGTQSNMSTDNSIASSSTTVSTRPTSKNECTDDGYFGNVEDCKKFYRCVSNDKGDFTKYDYICGEGTIWDQDITACNHPQDVTNPSCKSDQESSSTTVNSSSHTSPGASTLTESTTIKNEMNSTSTNNENSNENSNDKNITCKKAGFYANPNDCKKFYRCVDWDSNGEKFSIFHFECGEGTIWDPSLETCNHADSVYPPRSCNGTSQPNENKTESSETTEKATTTTNQETTTSQLDSTTQQITTTQQSTTQHTSSQQTTTQQQSSTTQQETTTQQQSSTTQQETTTQQQIITEQQTTTQQSPSSSSTSIETTQESTTQPSTTEKSTTQQPIATTTDQTSTQTTQEQTTVSESNTVSTTTESPEQSSTTGEVLTSTQPLTTEENISQTEPQNSTEASTTENQQQSSTESNIANQECPETEEDQFVLVCPTSFKRHPKYCNLFYQCTEDNESHEIKTATFTCPNNTIYDETKVQCVEKDKSDQKCDGEIAQRNRVKRLGVVNNEPIVVTRNVMACPNIGHFPIDKSEECSTVFLKCEQTKSRKLRGYIYKCPEGFVYWAISRKCESLRKLRDCKRPFDEWIRRHDIPVEKHNVAH
ncbi:serine-rich adhesin for platelets-like [Melitaea cinxia]|uniref:serine-rich adhesin for platelets-like n=1 Tax=Melitaea cinxia TaxID=113334 RepID=UPI001E273C65|nr:serine-rich adhesin for platelets-like [Melitaea cinxia]